MSSLLIKIFVPGNTQLSTKRLNEVVFPVACWDDTVKSFLKDNTFEPGLKSKISRRLRLTSPEEPPPGAPLNLCGACPPETIVTSLRASEPENTSREAVISLSWEDDIVCKELVTIPTPSKIVLTDPVSAFKELVVACNDAVVDATPSKIVLTDPVSEFKEPVVRSISSARNISEAVAAEADKFALFANPRANICEPLDAKSDFVVASLLAEVCVLEAASKIFTCEPLAANEADDLASDADTNSDDVANNIDAVFVATPSNTVLIEPVSAFKEPVVTSMESARNIS